METVRPTSRKKVSKNKIDYEGRKNENSRKMTPISIDMCKARKQQKIDILGIEIFFPYSPYENQITYMRKGNLKFFICLVVEALNAGLGSLAALESPTGTGKTLCLLCAALGWLRARREKLISQFRAEGCVNGSDEYQYQSPTIFYSSRTHSQLSNVIKELKKTCYLPRTAVLSSRDNMCVNSAVKNFKGNALNVKCKQVRIRKECKYFYGAERLQVNSYNHMDIEELFTMGSESGFCPFFFQRNKKDDADIVFLPYNYIFESQIRKLLKLKLANSILLIDEAHNIESVCEDCVSCELSVKMIEECLTDLKGIRSLLEHVSENLAKDSMLRGLEPEQIKDEELILNNIKGYMRSFVLKTGGSWPNIGLKLTSKEMFDVFFEGSKSSDKNQTVLKDIAMCKDSGKIPCLSPDNLKAHITFLRKIEKGISEELQKSSFLSNYCSILEHVEILSSNYLTFTISGDSNPNNNFCNNYKFFMNDIEDTTPVPKNLKNHLGKIRTLFLYCFNPGFGFKNILNEKLHSIIISSGTLSPIEGIESELKCSFQIKLENSHVIDKSQANFAILSNSFKKKILFKFDMNNRGNNDMIEELGSSISDLCTITPGGILVFFTSFSFMASCIKAWAEKEILSEIEKSKEIFQDMHDTQKNKSILKDFTECCDNGKFNNPVAKNKKGGILFSVCRGISSEGIDFRDDIARMVILVGIPYPSLGDVKVQLKREFLDEFNSKYFNYLSDKKVKKLSGSEWYTQCASRTVNQALGRVIRHVDDYGAMILIDQRYKDMLYKRLFSAWIRENAKTYEDNRLIYDTKNFFEKMKVYIAEKKNKKKEKLKIDKIMIWEKENLEHRKENINNSAKRAKKSKEAAGENKRNDDTNINNCDNKIQKEATTTQDYIYCQDDIFHGVNSDELMNFLNNNMSLFENVSNANETPTDTTSDKMKSLDEPKTFQNC